MDFAIADVQKLIVAARSEPATSDPWLDERYMDDMGIIGHTNPYYKLFYLMANNFKPEFSVELGTYRGVASGSMAAGNPGGIVYAIDWHRDEVDKVHQKCAIAMAEHFPNMTYLNMCSWDDETVAAVRQIYMLHPIDILFIDAWHWYEHAIREWKLYTPMLSDHALVVCDDINDKPGATVDMVKFWNEVSMGRPNCIDNDTLHQSVVMGFIEYIR